jgi:hypothetical protein
VIEIPCHTEKEVPSDVADLLKTMLYKLKSDRNFNYSEYSMEVMKLHTLLEGWGFNFPSEQEQHQLLLKELY